MSLNDKVVHSSRIKGAHDFVCELSLVHRDHEGPYGGWLSLEMRLWDRTDTATQSVQIVNTICSEDLGRMAEALKGIQDTMREKEKALDAFNQARRALA